MWGWPPDRENAKKVLQRLGSGGILNSVSSVVSQDPEILGGEPVFTGTRVPVKSLFDHLEAGDSIEEFLKGFPSNSSIDRKSTRLNSSHVSISYAVFCLKKKKKLIVISSNCI